MVITQHLGEPLRLAQNVENPIEIAKGNERTVKIEPKIDRPGNSLGALGEIGEGFECLFPYRRRPMGENRMAEFPPLRVPPTGINWAYWIGYSAIPLTAP
jgi:hypothetical protein